MKFIPLDAVLAEIKRYKHKADERLKIKNRTLLEESKDIALQNLCGNLLHYVNSLEGKEVDLETQIEDYINSHFTEGCDGGMISDWYKVLGGVHYKDLVEIAKHFFELGVNASNPLTWEDIRLLDLLCCKVDMSCDLEEKEHYEEVLKRFKVKKGEKV